MRGIIEEEKFIDIDNIFKSEEKVDKFRDLIKRYCQVEGKGIYEESFIHRIELIFGNFMGLVDKKVPIETLAANFSAMDKYGKIEQEKVREICHSKTTQEKLNKIEETSDLLCIADFVGYEEKQAHQVRLIDWVEFDDFESYKYISEDKIALISNDLVSESEPNLQILM